MKIEELLRLARSGDREAEQEIFEWLSERFAHFAGRRIWDKSDVQDVCQEALLAIAREYKETEYQVSFTAWAYKVLNNRILRYIEGRAKTRKRFESLPDAEKNPAASSDVDLRLQLHKCLKKLHDHNRRHAAILTLHQQGFTTDEICARLNLSKNALYIALSRARQQLERCLKTGEMG